MQSVMLPHWHLNIILETNNFFYFILFFLEKNIYHVKKIA